MMVLMDTHALLWAMGDDERLSATAKQFIGQNITAISIVSLWEMAIKASLPRKEKRLHLDRSIPEFRQFCEIYGIEILPITGEDCERIRTLQHIHEDPFDRMIIAQAIVRKLPIVTKDENIHKYSEVISIW